MTSTSAEPPRIEGTVLDHVAHAVPRWQAVWGRYAGDLGAVWSSGGQNIGFAPAQLRFANGARIELLMPWAVERNDFLARFLDRSGPGAHHLTFKVPDLDRALDHIRAAGFAPIGVDRSDPEWWEAFLHPKEAHGIVVQVAQALHTWSNPPPDDFPTEPRMRADGSGPVAPAAVVRICHVVADLDGALALFGGLLDGMVVDQGGDVITRWVDVRWPGPLTVRLVGSTGDSPTGAVADWLEGRTGRTHHLAVECEEPETVPGALPVADPFGLGGRDGPSAVWEVPAADNCGLALLLTGYGGASGSTSAGPVA